MARRVLLPLAGDRQADAAEANNSLRRAGGFSPDLLARLEAGAREAAPGFAEMRKTFQTPCHTAQGNLGPDAPLSAYGEFWSDANCEARLDRILARRAGGQS
jgi:hypothetical protein